MIEGEFRGSLDGGGRTRGSATGRDEEASSFFSFCLLASSILGLRTPRKDNPSLFGGTVRSGFKNWGHSFETKTKTFPGCVLNVPKAAKQVTTKGRGKSVQGHLK